MLAATTLQKRGVQRPGDHFVIVRARPTPTKDAPDGVGTILVSREPFSAADLDALDDVAARLRFEWCRARISRDETFAAIADGRQLQGLLAGYPLDISAPTDDSPFFFHMLRIRDVFNLQRWRDQGIVSFNMKAVGVLGVLLATVTLMTAACILLPLIRRDIRWICKGDAAFRLLRGNRPRLHARGDLPASAADNLPRPPAQPVGGPVLLLVSSGIGSLSTGRIPDEQTGHATRRRLLVTRGPRHSGIVTPAVTHRFEGADTPIRILIAVGILLPVGFCMGMAFPLGMRLAQRSPPSRHGSGASTARRRCAHRSSPS